MPFLNPGLATFLPELTADVQCVDARAVKACDIVSEALRKESACAVPRDEQDRETLKDLGETLKMASRDPESSQELKQKAAAAHKLLKAARDQWFRTKEEQEAWVKLTKVK